MIVNKERYNEIKNFVEDFNKQLQEAEKRVMENMNNINNSEDQTERKRKKSKKNFTENIFKDPPSWKPNNYCGEYFEDFKRLMNKKQMNDWEIERIHMIPRSFTKAKELKNKDWRHPNYFGTEFGDNKNKNLSDLGQRIMSTFIKDNNFKESLRKEQEDEFERIKHSKPPLNINKWKTSMHQMDYFGVYDIDRVHSFSSRKEKKFLIAEPFKRPKIDGEYFGKIVYDVNAEKEKMKKEKLEIKKSPEV